MSGADEFNEAYAILTGKQEQPKKFGDVLIQALSMLRDRIIKLETITVRQDREIQELKEQVRGLSVRPGHEVVRNMLVGGHSG